MRNESCFFGPASLLWTPLNPLTCHLFLPSQEKHVPIAVTAQSTLGPGPSPHPTKTVILPTRQWSCICYFDFLLIACGGLNRYGPHRFMCLSAWPQ